MDIVIVCIAVFGWLCMMPNLIWEGFMRKIPKPPEHLRPKKNGSVPRMRNPPPPPNTICVCNDIANHSPGGRCEACYSKNTMPRYENPPPPPPPIKEGNCYLDCGNTKPFPRGNGSICLNCGSSILKDEELEFLRPEFPKNRIE